MPPAGVLQPAQALRTRLALRPRATILIDRHGELRAEDLLDLVRLHRRRRRGAPAGTLGALPVTAPLRQVLVTALAGPHRLELRTGGGTGHPRLHRRGPLTPAQLLTLTALARRTGLRPRQRVACLAPGVSGHGLLVALGALWLGAPVVDLSHLPAFERLSLLHSTSPQILTGMPVHLLDVLRAEQELRQDRPLRISRIVSSAELLAPELRADLSRQYRARVHDVYGTTETGPLTVDGRPLPGVHLRARDGVLRARTAFTAGRELVTDRGEVDADGTVTVRGRILAPPMVGAAASPAGIAPHTPAELVQVLVTHPGVDRVSVQLAPDARTGVRLTAEVELDPEADPAVLPTSESLRAMVHDRLGAAAMPREVRISSPAR